MEGLVLSPVTFSGSLPCLALHAGSSTLLWPSSAYLQAWLHERLSQDPCG